MIEMIKLPYSLDALEPYYSRETLNLHYNVLYKGYVSKTNDVLTKLEVARSTNDYSNIKCLEKELSFQGSGAILHQLFFENMISPKNITSIDYQLIQKITNDFGSVKNIKKQF